MSFIFPFFRFFVVLFLGGGVYKAKIPHFANLSLNHFKIAAIKFNIYFSDQKDILSFNELWNTDFI